MVSYCYYSFFIILFFILIISIHFFLCEFACHQSHRHSIGHIHSGSGISPQVCTPNLSSRNNNKSYECPLNYICCLCGKSGHYVQDCTGAASAMTPMLHNPSQLQQALTSGNATTLQQLGAANGINGLGTNPSSLNTMSSLTGLGGINQTNQSLNHQSLNGMLGGGVGGGINGGNNNNGSNMGNQNGGSTKNPPPANYVCHKCNVVGHWIQECPLNTQQQQDYTKPPPANYICHRCGVPGHWIKNCPTNGNPTFDNKPHLKVIKTQEGTTTVMTSSDGTVNTVNSNDNSSNGQVNTASQPPSKKRRLNQM